jgi:hypothetical protein
MNEQFFARVLRSGRSGIFLLSLASISLMTQLEEIDAQIVASAANPMLIPPRRHPVSQEMKLRIRQDCLSRKQPAANTAK